jgi:hypothetical protein
MGRSPGSIISDYRIALAFFDGKMLRRILVIFGATVAQMAAAECLPVCIFGADGLSDGCDDPDHSKLHAQLAQPNGSEANDA